MCWWWHSYAMSCWRVFNWASDWRTTGDTGLFSVHAGKRRETGAVDFGLSCGWPSTQWDLLDECLFRGQRRSSLEYAGMPNSSAKNFKYVERNSGYLRRTKCHLSCSNIRLTQSNTVFWRICVMEMSWVIISRSLFLGVMAGNITVQDSVRWSLRRL